jgi:hypothetical protein
MLLNSIVEDTVLSLRRRLASLERSIQQVTQVTERMTWEPIDIPPLLYAPPPSSTPPPPSSSPPSSFSQPSSVSSYSVSSYSSYSYSSVSSYSTPSYPSSLPSYYYSSSRSSSSYSSVSSRSSRYSSSRYTSSWSYSSSYSTSYSSSLSRSTSSYSSSASYSSSYDSSYTSSRLSSSETSNDSSWDSSWWSSSKIDCRTCFECPCIPDVLYLTGGGSVSLAHACNNVIEVRYREATNDWRSCGGTCLDPAFDFFLLTEWARFSCGGGSPSHERNTYLEGCNDITGGDFFGGTSSDDCWNIISCEPFYAECVILGDVWASISE